MPWFDLTQHAPEIQFQIGDIVFDFDFRFGRAPRLANGVKGHVGMVVEVLSDKILIAHVGDHDLKVEAWNTNIQGSSKINAVGRLALEPKELAELGKLLRNRAMEVSALVQSSEAHVEWAAVEEGRLYCESPFYLKATCIGFVQWCYEQVGWPLISVSSIPLSSFHGTTCSSKHGDAAEWSSLPPLRRLFPGYAAHALALGKTNYTIPPAPAADLESAAICYSGLIDPSSVRVLPCLSEHLTPPANE